MNVWKSFVLTSGILGVLMGMTGPPACAAEDEAARGDEMRPQVQPLIRGALWWIQPQVVDWSDEQLEKAIQAQRDVGFDLLWLLNAAGVLAQDGGADLLERIYSLADQKNMKVIIDLPQGGWYRKASAEDLIALVTEAVRDLHGRYGHHSSFHAWYLNYEINPIRPGDTEETAFWRHVWKSITAECHRVAPGSLVTISPFFLLDDTSRRGFIYLTPQQYADWWGATLKETGIDVIMLQDSGEHLAFFTLEQREPYWAATARAAREAGAQFWLNVETGEADVRSWDEFLPLEAQRKVPWRFTPIEWLEHKLLLAAKYSDNIINWGYFPFMDPYRNEGGQGASGGEFGEEAEASRAAYKQYQAYYQRVMSSPVSQSPL